MAGFENRSNEMGQVTVPFFVVRNSFCVLLIGLAFNEKLLSLSPVLGIELKACSSIRSIVSKQLKKRGTDLWIN